MAVAFACNRVTCSQLIYKRGHMPPSGNVVKCFCALVVTAKRSVDEFFMHYFHNLSSKSGGKGAQTPSGLYLSLEPLG